IAGSYLRPAPAAVGARVRVFAVMNIALLTTTRAKNDPLEGDSSMSGHIRRRGKSSWELKFDIGTDPVTGKRLTRYHSFKGSKREAERKLTDLLAQADKGNLVPQSTETVGEYLDRWLRAWVPINVSRKTGERYGELLKTHVIPRLGLVPLQKLRPA